MGDLYHDGRVVGGNSSIDDSDVDLHKTWSSEKINGEIEEVSDRVEVLESELPSKADNFTLAGTVNGNNTFNMPSGWKEALIQVVYNNTFLNSYHLSNGYYQSTPSDTSLGNYGTSYIIGRISKKTLQVILARWDNLDVIDSIRTYIYTR